jgi:hypothetical protein
LARWPVSTGEGCGGGWEWRYFSQLLLTAVI